jgi:hypothetical protein
MLALVEEIGSHPVDLAYWIFLEKGIFERCKKGTT